MIIQTGILASEGDKRLGDPPPRYPGAFNGLTGMKTPKRIPWRWTASACSGSALLVDLPGVSRSMERDLLSLLLIYPRIFLHVFIVYHLLSGILFALLYPMQNWIILCGK